MAKRRLNGEGSIIKRKDGRIEARVSLPGGKRISCYGKTQKEAMAKASQRLRDALVPSPAAKPPEYTFAEWARIWFTAYGETAWRESTAYIHLTNLNNKIIPALGETPLSELSTHQIQLFVKSLLDAPLKPSTIHKIAEPLRGALKQAAENGLIEKSPMSGVKLPTLRDRPVPRLLPEEKAALDKEIPNSAHGRAIRLIIYTGLRTSEIVGLNWSDIRDGGVSAARAARYQRAVKDGCIVGKSRLVVTDMKSEASHRFIPAGPSAKRIIDAQRQAQRQERLRAGAVWQAPDPAAGDCPVFATPNGKRVYARNLLRTLHAALKRAGLAKRGLHALRDTFACDLNRNGVDARTISELLGHVKVSFTFQKYVRSDKSAKLDAVNSLG
jgi:integrase